MKNENRSASLSGSSNGSSGLSRSNRQFLVREKVEVEAIVGRSMSDISPLWHWIDPDVQRFLGDIIPVGPMKSREPVFLVVVSDYNERFRKPCEVLDAVRAEMQVGRIWDLLWLLARMRKDSGLWERYSGSVALGSPVSDGLPERRFPYVNGTARKPHVRLVSELSIGDPARRFRYVGRPIDAPMLQMTKSPVS